jgi:hypothetical protein
MGDELVTVSATQVLQQIQENSANAVSDLDEALGTIGDLLRPPTGEGPYLDDSSSRVVAQVEVKLRESRGSIQNLLSAANLLKVARAQPTDPPEHMPDVRGSTPEPPSGDDTLLLGAGMSPTTRYRMSEISGSLRLGDQQTLERCVATQYFVDTKLREGWRFYTKRGRERHAISFPGQIAV